MPAQSCVGVFWDLENCSIPSCMPGETAAQRVRAAVAHFGDLVEFNAYGDACLTGIKRKKEGLRAGGVHFIDTPHDSKKQVADMRIIADIIAFALDRPSPVTIILISADGDFAHAVSVLQDRRHTVWIISSHFNTSEKLRCRADGMMSWRWDVLERAFESETQLVISKLEVENNENNEPPPGATFGAENPRRPFGESQLRYEQPTICCQTSSSSYNAATRSAYIQTFSGPFSQFGSSCSGSIITSSIPPASNPHLTTTIRPAPSPPTPNRPSKPSRFSLLITVLRRLRSSLPENPKALKLHKVAAMLRRRDPTVFDGYRSPKSYMLKARAAGVIDRFKAENGTSFVSLHPDYY